MTKLEGLNQDFRDILLSLADENVDFLVIGAYALAFHGAPRGSGDIDIFVRPTEENAKRVFQALSGFGAPLEAHGIGAADFARPGTVYQVGLPPRRIDVLNEISGVTFEEAWNTRIAATLEGRTINVIGRDAYIKNKESSGRLKDLADVERLRHRKPSP